MHKFYLLVTVSASALLSCAGTAAGVQVTDEPAGANCASGGLKIEVGPDDNDDGAPDEVTSTSYVCDGADGADAVSTLTATMVEVAGANCANGGTRLVSGSDTNSNGTLDAAEITSTNYSCNGLDAIPTLLALGTEVAGTSVSCPDGGTRIDSGPDTNKNGTLDGSEIASTRYACNGADGIDGDPVALFGAQPMVNAYSEGPTTAAANTDVTTQQATITVPHSGRILVLSTVGAYCSSTGAPMCGAFPHDPYVTIANLATASGTSGNRAYFYLANDESTVVTNSAVYPVGAGGGTFTFYIRARGDNNGATGFYRSGLTLVFVPN